MKAKFHKWTRSQPNADLTGGKSEAGRERKILLGSEGAKRLKNLRKSEVRVQHDPYVEFRMKKFFIFIILAGFAFPQQEPDILDVFDMAIEYNNLSPKQIKNWQRRVRYKTFLPKLSLSYDKTIYKGKNDTAFTGPMDWSLSFTWDLDEFIYSDKTISIDERSRLMTQLRQNILDELSHLYFERKRLLIKLDEVY